MNEIFIQPKIILCDGIGMLHTCEGQLTGIRVYINKKAYVDILYLTPWSRVLEKLTVPELFETLPAFYGARKLITMFTRIRYLSLS